MSNTRKISAVSDLTLSPCVMFQTNPAPSLLPRHELRLVALPSLNSLGGNPPISALASACSLFHSLLFGCNTGRSSFFSFAVRSIVSFLATGFFTSSVGGEVRSSDDREVDESFLRRAGVDVMACLPTCLPLFADLSLVWKESVGWSQ